jgi:Flp pilus assembly pilin Flp
MPAQRRRQPALQRWLWDEQGVETVEYARLLAVLVVASVGAWIALGGAIKTTLATATNAISQPVS